MQLLSGVNKELERLKLNFFVFDPRYHIARYNFIRHVPKSCTPSCLATHRSVSGPAAGQTELTRLCNVPSFVASKRLEG